MERSVSANEAGIGGRSKGTGLVARARGALADSAWGALVGKGALYLAGFALLALVGAGKLRWPSPPHAGTMSVGVAEAAAAPLPSVVPASHARTEASAIAASPSAAPTAEAAAGAVDEKSPKDAKAADGGAAPSGVTADGKVVLNLATEEDLRRLPSIGATRAKAILALRARLGKFSRVEDLLKVKGIGRRSLARLKPLVLVDPA